MNRSSGTSAPPSPRALVARCLTGEVQAAVNDIRRRGLWEYVVSEACDAGLAGALLDALRAADCEPPEGSGSALEAHAEHVAEANAYRISRAARVLARLQAEGVPFMLLKGAALIGLVYERPGRRAMTDIDVLIRVGDARRVDELLTAAGCVPGPGLVREDFYPRFYNEREYFTPDHPPVRLDVHARPFRPLRYVCTVPPEGLWESPERAAFGPLRVAVPGPEDMLVHLAVHHACHGCAELRWACDVYLWLERYADRIDPQRVAARCRRWRVSLAVRRSLQHVRDLFGPGMVDAVLESLPPGRHLGERLVLDQAPHDLRRPLRGLVVHTLCTPGLSHRLGYLGAVLFPGRQHMGQLYPRRHPGWLAVAHLTRAARLLTRPFHRDNEPDGRAGFERAP